MELSPFSDRSAVIPPIGSILIPSFLMLTTGFIAWQGSANSGRVAGGLTLELRRVRWKSALLWF